MIQMERHLTSQPPSVEKEDRRKTVGRVTIKKTIKKMTNTLSIELKKKKTKEKEQKKLVHVQ